jgi:hypothetical protein
VRACTRKKETVMVAIQNSALTYIQDDILLDEVAENQWRVLDGRLPKENVAALRGFVRAFVGLYEVTTMAQPSEVVYCADLRAVHAAFADVPEDLPEPESVVASPHSPPQ